MQWLNSWHVFAQLFRREISNRYLGSLSGLLWVFLHPVLLMVMYAVLIGSVLKARIPGVSDLQWLPYIALGLWPWMCFSEALQRGTSSVLDHAPLLGKVALPKPILVVASVAASFVLQVTGMLLVLVGLRLLGYPLHLSGLPQLLFLLVLLFALTLGLAWGLSAAQVYLRDVGQVLTQLLGFGFFLTPILYTPAMLPDVIRAWLPLNPMSFYVTGARDVMLLGQTLAPTQLGIALIIAIAALVLGFSFFNRLAPRFEDFL